MIARLIEIDKKLYAVGFNWNTFNTDKKALPSKADENFDVYALSRFSKQFGLALTNKNEQFLIAQSLAAMIKIDASYIGVFTLKDIEDKEFYWVYAVQKGQLLGFCDTVCETTEEVQKILDTFKEFSSTSVEAVFFNNVAESVDFIKNNLFKTRNILNLHKIHALYKSKKHSSQNKKIVFFCLVLFGVIFALIQYFDIKNVEELRSAALFSKQTTENKIKNIYANTHKYFPMDWKKSNFPLDVFNACQPVMFSLPVNVNGWALEKSVCTSKEMTSVWKHERQASFIELPFDGKLTSPQEVTAKHCIADIKLVQNKIEYTSLLSQEESSKLLYQLTQNMGANITLSYGKSDVKEFKELKISIVSPWKQCKFEWKSVPSNLILNSSLFEALNTIPSLSVNSIEYSNGQWSVKGDLYVKS